MERALAHATAQYKLKNCCDLNIQKPIHIGETGWASVSKGIYGASGSHAEMNTNKRFTTRKSINGQRK